MLPPMVIFKGKTLRTIRDVVNKGKSISTYQEKAWMNEAIMKEWIVKVWVVLLILDRFSAHNSRFIQEI